MRIRLYDAITARLAHVRTVEGVPVFLDPKQTDKTAQKPPQAIKAFDLWNENVVQLTKQRPFEMPAVFIEFLPIVWSYAGRKAKHADVTVRLHIVTATLATPNSPYKEQALYRLALIRAVDQALTNFSGAVDDRGLGFGTFVPQESDTDHNHEQVCEDIEMWRVSCFDLSAVGRNLVTTPLDVTLDDGEIFTALFSEEYV